jgi:heme exporter protein B
VNLAAQIISLVKKDLMLEWRQRYALGGIVLYVLSTVFVIYISLSQENALQSLEKKTWNILFWVTILFAAVNAIAKSFTQENRERLLYYYTLTSPQAVILSKIIYNTILMLLLSLICLAVYALMIGYPVSHFMMFIVALIMGGSGFSFIMTMISAIASKATNNTTLMAVLSFPLMLPLILVLMRLSRVCFIEMAGWEDAWNDMMLIAALDVLVVSLSYILFPYLWKD